MRRLASRLDEAADRLHQARRVVGATRGLAGPAWASLEVWDGPLLGAVAVWASQAAADLRRRALMLEHAGSASGGADEARQAALAARFEASGYEADPGLFGHGRRVTRHGLRALRDSIVGPVRGIVHMAGATVRAETEPVRVVVAGMTGGRRAAVDEIEGTADELVGVAGGGLMGVTSSARQSLALTPVVQAGVFAARVDRDGFWRAVEDNAADNAAALPGELLSVVPGGEEASGARAVASSQVRSPSTAASALGGIGASGGSGGSWKATENDREILELSVPVPGTDEVVAVDYNNGDFLVARPGAGGRGAVVERHRWSRLGRQRQEALRAHGLVDQHGHPFGER